MGNAGGEVHALAADLGRDEECDRLFAWATSTLGGLDILVNNTVGPPTGGVLEVSDDQWRESFDLIFMSALRLSRAGDPGHAGGRRRIDREPGVPHREAAD